ncbi:MAG: hypothetical protein ACLQG3_12670 [Terracidiphilus sp.]
MLEKRSTAGATVPALFVALPAALFYGILFRCLVNLPVLDDYDALLGFLNQVVQQKGAAARLLSFLAAQHNEYKLFFAHGVAWAQFALVGHVNFSCLCVLGSSAVLVLALILWRMFLPAEKDFARRLAFFVPVAWLLFQLSYWETLDWAMASLENLWVVVFSLGAIGCLLRPSRKSFAAALVLYALAIAASGNGFLLLPLGLLVLGLRRRLVRAAGWLAVSAVCIAAYAYRYNPMSSQSPSHGSVFSALLHLRPDYAIAFAGNAGAIAGKSALSIGISLALGASLLALFGWLARRGYGRRNPFVSCSVLFVLLTALGVAGLRSEFGLTQSLEPRYTIYGVLLAIFAWAAVAEEFVQHRRGALLNNTPYLAMAAVAVLFSLCMDEIGYLNLARRERDAIAGMAAFEQSAGKPASGGPVLPFPHETANLTAFRARAREILSESIRLGVYQPPSF